MAHPSDPLDAVRDFQLRELKANVDDLRNDLKGATATMGGQITALQTQLIAWQTSMGQQFTPRLEAKVVNDNIDQRIADNTKRVERLEQAFWGVLTLLLGTLGTAVFALLRQPPGH
jgi:hypothetical protein